MNTIRLFIVWPVPLSGIFRLHGWPWQGSLVFYRLPAGRQDFYQYLQVFTSIFTSFYIYTLAITNPRMYLRGLLIRLEHRIGGGYRIRFTFLN
ncbi:hypothetical protein A3A63_03650 [Candidatus Gottesmanbacteria bacterium RIFCSPLOWO2_01_FULL_46_9]|uniref:Uncharacterized protein n=1 Tax=Candidatus Gottesmanbacteria bacterium RIFCSPLOWO2_01_FULL_46_9 TaxID=1798394 RepID=A0A1F6B3V9_9BACT|nr:MAG: hypothetical protein A3A63_03650 [Candidatus Gottesmanbacteria bacterium RIFCSPLOWO2_01_FULL_46_9]